MIPTFVADLRRYVGHSPLWLISATAVIAKECESGGIETLLIRRADSGEWSPVSGIVEPGESPDSCARREAREEAGVDIEIRRLAWVAPTDLIAHANGDMAWYLDLTFLCSWISGRPHADDEESLGVKWFRLTELPPMLSVMERRIVEACGEGSQTRVGW